MSSLLQVEKLTAGYGMTPVLFEVDLELVPGELVALIGANGAGKSTLLGALSGLVRVSSGTVRLAGRELTGRRPEMIVASGMVHVPQGRRLFSTMTVERNLLLGAYRRHDRQVREDFEKILGYFPALSNKLDREAGTLSGGEQQMVGIGPGPHGAADAADDRRAVTGPRAEYRRPRDGDRQDDQQRWHGGPAGGAGRRARARDRRPRLRAGKRPHRHERSRRGPAP